MTGYYSFPTVYGDTLVFTCEDDLWSVSTQGGRAYRLTADVAAATNPRLSPDGQWLAFIGRTEGHGEVYVAPATGGEATRLTYFGATQCSVAGWHPQTGEIVFASDGRQPFFRLNVLYSIGRAGGEPAELPYGPANQIAFGPGGAVVLGRNIGEPARWKRYRGGTAGDLWIDPNGGGDFHRLIKLSGNLASACWVGTRIYFLSDHEGVGNVYSCAPDGTELRRHTDHEDFYARNLSGDETRLVYQAGADLYLLDPAEDQPRRLDITLPSSRTQRSRRFVEAASYFDSATLHPDGTGLALTSRGKAFSFASWEGAVSQHGEPDGVRYRKLAWLPDRVRLVAAASDDGPAERLVVLTADGSAAPNVLDGLDVGRVVDLAVAPTGDRVAITNHRNELLLVGVDEPVVRRLDHSGYGRIEDPAWSPDGRWLAYSHAGPANTQSIKLINVVDGRSGPATQPVVRDYSPAWDPEGKYLYIIGLRDFNPVYDQLHFDLGFPTGGRPYAITLRADVPSPFVPVPRPVVDPSTMDKSAGDKPAGKKNDDEPVEVEIDLDGIERRIVAFPAPEARYLKVAAAHGRVFFLSEPTEDVEDDDWDPVKQAADGTLETYDFQTQKRETFADGVTDFWIGPDAKTLLYRSGRRLRVVSTAGKPSDSEGDEPGRASGWLDLDRVKVSVRPAAEWRQMFREAWRLQREHFWTEDMSGVDWNGAYERYLPLVDRVTTRAEFSDLLWELQGELGTSHAYEAGGEYRPGPYYRQGFLGFDWSIGDDGRYRVDRILGGDPWVPAHTSPLNRPGVDVAVGDEVVAVNGQPLAAGTTPGALLVNLADEEVTLTVRRGGDAPRMVTVRALGDERPARYRDWVEGNRAYVHERTEGRVGYLHIPDMGLAGYAEFHRGFLREYDRRALVVDVRFNRGGHVSSLLMEKLARRRIGYNYPRWSVPEPYPEYAPRGPLVALTNERAGSDGDIFCHTFKLRGLGPVVGKRTWGGVIGIWPRHSLADGTVTTQPEFSFAFDDVGWRVENYGTDPDIEVDITPQDYNRGVDAQLDRAIEEALKLLDQHPPHTPDPADRIRLVTPKLPPRP
jgi:tricorn protease